MPVNIEDQPHPIQRALQWYGVGLEYEDLKKISRLARTEGEVVKEYEDAVIYKVYYKGALMYPVIEGHIIKTFYRKGYL